MIPQHLVCALAPVYSGSSGQETASEGERGVGMSDKATQELIVTAKGEAEACDQLVFWAGQLQSALDARRRLLEVPAQDLKAALESRR